MKHTCRQGCAKKNENVIARSVSNEAISKNKIATPSARNDRIETFSGESYLRKLFTNNRGFTLIETIMVMVIIVILAAVVIIRNPFGDIKLYSATRKVAADIRYAQKLAISNQTRAGIVFTANGYSVYNNVTPPPNPLNLATSPGDPCSTSATNTFVVNFADPTGRCSNYTSVTLSVITIAFNSLGTPVDPTTGLAVGPQSVTVTYNGSKLITIEQGTGRVSY